MTYPRTVQIRQTRPFRPSFCCVLPPPHPPFPLSFQRLPLTHHALWLCAKPNRLFTSGLLICCVQA